jgi:hypothetical protein
LVKHAILLEGGMAKGDEGRDKSDRKPVLVDFALQGGGSHGAFTWGVLARVRGIDARRRSELDVSSYSSNSWRDAEVVIGPRSARHWSATMV